MLDHYSESEDVLAYLARHEHKDLLRFVTVGSVDDGKSTLIGRLLFDTQGVYEDQLAAVKRASGGEIDLSLITDGLRAEREQKITIDVAYRYFSTKKRKFIVADTPGHVQYTRNMATGASTSDVALILVDARHGVLPQTRRHAFIASLVGIERLLVCVNKMDLVSFQEARVRAIESELREYGKTLHFDEMAFVPVSALRGDNVVHKSESMPWYAGPTVLEYLEQVPGAHGEKGPLRLPIQLVLRPNLDFRAYAGQLASGRISVGDEVRVMPSRKVSRVKAIEIGGVSVAHADAPKSVSVRLEDELDASRGDMLVAPAEEPAAARSLRAMLVCLHERGLDIAKTYWLKHTSKTVRATVRTLVHRIDLETLVWGAAPRLELNDVGEVELSPHMPILVDAYTANRTTGSFVLIDPLTNDTVAAGMVLSAESLQSPQASLQSMGAEGSLPVTLEERRLRFGHGAVLVKVSGPLDNLFVAERVLFDAGLTAIVLGPDALSRSSVDSALAAGLVVLVHAETAESLELEAHVSVLDLSEGQIPLCVHLLREAGRLA